MLIAIQRAELLPYICYLAPQLITELLTAFNVCHSKECQDQSGKLRQGWFEGREPGVWYGFMFVLRGRARNAVGEGMCFRILSRICIITQALSSSLCSLISWSYRIKGILDPLLYL